MIDHCTRAIGRVQSVCQDEVLKYTGKAKANLQSFINVQRWNILEDLEQSCTFLKE